jgi:hypothetical protein
VAGANNDPTPGKTAGEPTGTGDTLLQNLAALGADGMLKIDSTGPSGFVTVDVPLGDPVGREGTNPFAGMTPEEAVRAMYWENAVDPTYTEVGGFGRAVVKLVKLGVNGLRSPAARAEFHWAFRQLDRASQTEVIIQLGRVAAGIEAQWKGNVPPALRADLEEILELVEQLIEAGPIIGPDSGSAPLLYADVSSERKANGVDTGNTGVCGQIQQATATGVSAPAGLSFTGDWAHITLQGTAHGTLIDEIKALAPSAVSCPAVAADVTAGRWDVVNLFRGCTGTIVGARILTRDETRNLSPADRAILMAGNESDPFVAGALDYSTWASGWAQGWPKPEAQALLADGHVFMFGDSADGNLRYESPLSAGGLSDVVVVAAIDESGVEHPFLVKIAVKSPATCSGDDRPVGPGTGGFRAVIQDGSLQLVRNVSFTLDPKMFCTADVRDSFTVTMDSPIPGTTPTIDPDGSITFTWTDPDVVGDAGVLTVTPWDETTGVPGEPLEIPVVVRDVAPSCDDLEVDYDKSELKGAPLVIPTNCGMEGGLAVLAPPYLAFNVPGSDLLTQVVDGGTFTSDGTTVSFTPGVEEADVSTAHVVPWTIDPRMYSLFRVHGKAFDIDVRMTD